MVINIYVYTSGQTNDKCPLSGRTISKNLAELLYAIECHKDSLEDQIIPTYVLITSHILEDMDNDNSIPACNIYTIIPNGEVLSREPDDSCTGLIYKKAVKEVTTTDIKKYGIGPRMKIASAFIQWHQGCYLENIDGSISKDMEDFIKESRVETNDSAVIRTDLDAVSAIMKNGDLNREDIIAVRFRDNMLNTPKDIEDFLELLSKVILPKEDDTKPFVAPATEIFIDDIDDYRYEIQFSDKSTIERQPAADGTNDIFIGECDATTMSDL